MFGSKTVRIGERVAVWSPSGMVRSIDGPKRLLLFRETVEPPRRFSVAADEYLVIRFRSGAARHVVRPADA